MPASMAITVLWVCSWGRIFPVPVFAVKIRSLPFKDAAPSPPRPVPTVYLLPVMVPTLLPKPETSVILLLASSDLMLTK